MTKQGLLFGVFLAGLVSAVAFLSQPRKVPNIGETPLLTIELGGDFSKAETRDRLLAFEAQLRKSGAFEFVGGPGRFRYFVPGSHPVPRPLESLKDEEWSKLVPNLKSSENAQVHFFNENLNRCVFRCVPRNQNPSMNKVIEGLLAKADEWDSFELQSRSVASDKKPGFASSWGNQALSVRIGERAGYFFDVAILRIVTAVLQRLRRDPNVIGARSISDFVADIRRAQNKDPEALLTQRDYDAVRPLLFLRSPERFESPCLSRDGATLSVVILTNCPEAKRGELLAWVRSQLSEISDGGSIEGLPRLRSR
ncbi:MAG: hypothetical protein P1V97_36760 [Planctomycetota bacterium]|nr:hypothetical protein [Planctomycetota bacterium]